MRIVMMVCVDDASSMCGGRGRGRRRERRKAGKLLSVG